MIKGFAAALAGAIVASLIVVGLIYLFFTGILAWIIGIFTVGMFIAVAIIFVITFIIFLLMFFAFFYYLAEKKPEIKPGEYKLDQEKGKNE